MMLIVFAVTVFNVLTQGYCQGNLSEIQVTLTENTRVIVCVCSDADTCTADNWKDLLAECRKKAANVGHEVMEASSTSTKEPTTSTQEPTTSTQASCVTDCAGLTNDNYQSCKGCTEFVLCHNGQMMENLCPGGTEWDDNSKTCTFPEFSTCV